MRLVDEDLPEGCAERFIVKVRKHGSERGWCVVQAGELGGKPGSVAVAVDPRLRVNVAEGSEPLTRPRRRSRPSGQHDVSDRAGINRNQCPGSAALHSSHAPASTTRMYAVLRALFNYAEDSELIPRSPCRRIRLPQPTPRTAEILDADGLALLADAVGANGAMVYLGAFGLRWGEVAGLRVGRLDFLRQTITIDSQRTRGLHGEMIDADPKTKAGRRSALALPDWLMAMLAEILASRGVTASTPDALVFVSPDGAPLHYSNWRRRVWRPARAAAGFPS